MFKPSLDLNALEQMLNKLGYGVLKTDSDQRVLEVFKQNRDKICLVILDADIPQSVGSKILSNMKIIDPEIKFMMTGKQLPPQYIEEDIDFENGSFLQKPFSLSGGKKAMHCGFWQLQCIAQSRR